MNPIRSSQPCRLITACIAALLFAAASVRTASAIDEVESLDLLVESLGDVEDASVLRALMSGMLKGLEGRRDVKSPSGWGEVAAKLNGHDDEGVRDLSNQLSQIFGDEAAVQRALAIVRDSDAEPQARRKNLLALLDQQNREASGLLKNLLDEPGLQIAAIRGYATVEHKDAPAILLKRYPAMSPELRRAAIETLATRKPYADALLKAVRDEVVARDDIPTHVARSLSTLLGDRFAAVFGKPPTLGADREKLIAQWKSRMSPSVMDRADASRGRVVFKKTCASCHLLYGEGGKIGPDLTGSNRANLDYILLNSVDPSFDVPAAYRMVTIITTDGLVANGIIAEEDGTRVILKTVEKPRLVIAKSDIDERIVSKKSMMPDGQLEKLKRQEVFDLIQYLRTTEQVELPE